MSVIVLEEFSIHGINGDFNVDLKIIDNRKILVSENGMGKTTILGIFYSFFKKSKKIDQYDFEYIKLKLKGDGKHYIFHKGLLAVVFDSEFFQDVNSIEEVDYKKFNTKIKSLKNNLKNFKSVSSEVELENLISSLFIYFHLGGDLNIRKMGYGLRPNSSSVLKNKFNQFAIHNFKKIFDETFSLFRFNNVDVDFNKLQEDVAKICEINDIGSDNLTFVLDWLNNLHRVLWGFLNIEFLYFTTYRVIEKNINTFKKDDDEYDPYGGVQGAVELFKDSPLIQFGMENVRNIWQKLSNDIRTSTTEEFLKLSGTLLKNVVNNKKVEENDIHELVKNKNSISKVLSRIDQETFDNNDKDKLISTIKNKNTIAEGENLALFYILQNMVSIYENQKHIDQAINDYCEAVNSFFDNKKIVFNDITSEIYVEINKNKKPIDIEDLSSGEKQIISIFTKLYLTNIDNDQIRYWIIYDEPEISLSIEWQQLILPKILDSNKCDFLLSATHSPFVFRNDLKKYTSDLSLEVTELN